MSSLGQIPGVRSVSRAVAVVALAGLVTASMGAPLGASSPAKAAKPQLTFSGAVKGKAKGIQTICTETRPLVGLPSLEVKMFSFTVGNAGYRLTLTFDDGEYKAGKHDFGAGRVVEPSVVVEPGVVVELDPVTANNPWVSGRHGTATLNKDLKSGKLDGTLPQQAGVMKDVHVKGTFNCGTTATTSQG